MSSVSAKGHKLNRRGRETRQHVLETAVRCLAAGGPEPVSANLIAREAGMTWGTVQHQFGDKDGLWAAVLDGISAAIDERGGALLPIPADVTGLSERVTVIIDTIWNALERPAMQAMFNLRSALPRARPDLEAEYPRTAAALVRWDTDWAQACRDAFADFDVDPVKLDRVRSLLPGAVRGLNQEQHLSSFTDFDQARRGLAEAITAYLS